MTYFQVGSGKRIRFLGTAGKYGPKSSVMLTAIALVGTNGIQTLHLAVLQILVELLDLKEKYEVNFQGSPDVPFAHRHGNPGMDREPQRRR